LADILERGIYQGVPVPAVGGYDARLFYPGEMGIEAAILVIAMHDISRFASTEGLKDARPLVPGVRESAKALRELAPRLSGMRDDIEHADERVHKAKADWGVGRRRRVR
jgi:hypothetical protein